MGVVYASERVEQEIIFSQKKGLPEHKIHYKNIITRGGVAQLVRAAES